MEWTQVIAPALILSLAGFGWKVINRMEDRIREDARLTHEAIGQNIEALRKEVREDLKEVRTNVNAMRQELTDLTGRLGRIEGLLEARAEPPQ